ncbi:hypothetical protein AGOR_G00014200 [Albula goreensis]|uniref:Soluble lamin-associated protein of 75 kDa-like n=1 Tax=Albula goreensis TaxID=1534307 RepID=A0A8T3E7H6_9TELE|nr:hypothetical protein AGOR_G00014200 [Albula goreensis]
MEFPVDILATLSHEELEHAAEDYMSDLLYSNPDKVEHFSLPNSRRIPLTSSNVGFVPLYGSDLKHKVLALFSPDDQFTAVALYLADQWWAVEDVIKTADPSRKGLLKVRSLGERIVLYVLNRIVYRANEMSKNEVPFLCHSESDYSKILWKNGEAIGFYSVKPTGSLCNSFLTQRYLLPVMDSIFVRKGHRGNGHGLQILEDFVDCFKEDSLGLKYPLSQAMMKVCGQYLSTYPADHDLLWEVESVGGPFQRARIASKLKTMAVSVNHHSGEDPLLHQNSSENDIPMEEEETISNSVEVTEVLINKHIRADIEDTPVSTRTRSSDYRRKRIREETEEVTEESLPDKLTRMEDAEAANVEESAGEAAEEVDKGVAGEELPGPVEEGVAVTGEEESGPANEEVEEPVALETPGEEEDNQTLEVELMAKVEAERINGEVTDDFEEEESTGEPAAVEENCAQEEEEGQKDVDMVEEAAEDVTEDKDTIEAAPEESVKTSPVEEEEESPSMEEDAPPAEDEATPLEELTSPGEEVLSAQVEEQTSPAEEALVDEEEAPPVNEQASPAEEASAAEEQTSIAEEEEEAPSTEEAVSPEKPDSPPAGESLSVNGDTPVDVPEGSMDCQKAPEVEEPSPEAVDKAVKVLPGEEEETMEEEPSPEAEPQKEADPPSEPSPPLDKTSVDHNHEAVLLVGLKEVSYQQPGDNENEQTAEAEEKMEEEEVQKEAVVEQEKETEDEKTEDEEKATTTEEEEEEGDTVKKSSDEANDLSTADTRVLRRKTKVIEATPKRKSTRLSKRPPEDEQTEPSEPEELEDESTEKEEEKATSTEEEAVEKSSDEGDDPPVVDRRVLRRKTKVTQSLSKPKTKRRSKT